MTPDGGADLEAIREALAAATPGPWEVLPFPEKFGWYIKAPPPPDRDWSGDHVGYVFRERDAEALVALRNAAPDLLAALDALRAENERLRAGEHFPRYASPELVAALRERPHVPSVRGIGDIPVIVTVLPEGSDHAR